MLAAQVALVIMTQPRTRAACGRYSLLSAYCLVRSWTARLLEQLLPVVHDLCAGEARDARRGLPRESLPLVCILDQVCHRTCQRRGILARHEQAVDAVPNKLTYAASDISAFPTPKGTTRAIGGDHRQAA